MPEWAHAFARRGHIVKMDNRDSDFILDLRFFNSLLGREICAVSFGFIASLIIVILAVLSVFVEIQIVTNCAFWFVIGAYIMLAGTCFD